MALTRCAARYCLGSVGPTNWRGICRRCMNEPVDDGSDDGMSSKSFDDVFGRPLSEFAELDELDDLGLRDD